MIQPQQNSKRVGAKFPDISKRHANGDMHGGVKTLKALLAILNSKGKLL